MINHKIKQDFKFLDKVEYSIGKFLLENNKPIEFDYYKKYSLSEEDFIKKDSEVCSEEKVNNDNFNEDVLLNGEDKSYEVKILNNKNEEELRRKLKQLRINFAIKEKLPPYCIFNDETLNDILDKMPKDKEELMKVKGLAKVKVNKYGEEILGVLN